MNTNTAVESTATLRQLTESLAALPPLPATAQEILTCFGDEFIDAEKVAAVVDRDPGICARLLGLANSAYFGLATPVSNMVEVISRVLGVDTVRSLVLAMAIQQSFNSRRCPAFAADQFWRQSMLTAECCKRIATNDDKANDTDCDLAYSAGLCHNIGLMALVHLESRVANEILSAHASAPVPGNLAASMRSKFGYDHRLVTAELAELWSLPAPMAEAYRFRAVKNGNPGTGRLALILAASVEAVSYEIDREECVIDLTDVAGSIDLSPDSLLDLATFTRKQYEQVSSLSGNMSC